MNRVFLVAVLLSCSSAVLAELPSAPGDFPQWRGPHRDGISSDKGLLKQWPEAGPEVAWQIDNVGAGYSSVAVKDGLLVTMGDLDGVEHIIALRAADGSRVWAVQPEPVAAALDERVKQEFGRLDRNGDGTIDEVEALSRIGWNLYKYDHGDSADDVGVRAKKLFSQLDRDGDGQLVYSEAGTHFGDQFTRIDTADNENADGLAQRRADELIADADVDNDDSVSRKESRKNYLGRIFNNADKRLPGERRGDQILTRDEVIAYFTKREAGQDGVLTENEVVDHYKKNISGGDGKLSRQELKSLYGGYRNGQGDGPRGTPTIDGDRVYTEGGNGDVTCLDLKTGKTVWHISLIDDLGGRRPGWGYSESPLVVGDLLIVTPGGDQGTLAALDKLTGKVIWRSTGNTEQAHYSSPVVATIGGIRQVVQFGRESAFGVTLDEGKLLWRYDGANNGTANCCTPIVHDDHVFVASAYGTGGGLAKITNHGDVQRAEEVYFEKKMGIHHGGIVKIGDYMYTCGGGTLMCVDFLSGEIVWQDRSVGKGSLVVADGMLYVLSERQKLALAEATPEGYQEHGRIELESQGRPSWAHPVVAGGVLYVRDQQSLTAFEVR